LRVPYEVRFRKKDGQIVGSDSYTSIEPVTDKVLEANERAGLEVWISRIKPNSLSMECLRAMKQAHDQNGGAA
jgi:maleate cis-trans isomerase